MSTNNLCFEQKYEKYQKFLSENFHVLVAKFSAYLNRHIFVKLRALSVSVRFRQAGQMSLCKQYRWLIMNLLIWSYVILCNSEVFKFRDGKDDFRNLGVKWFINLCWLSFCHLTHFFLYCFVFYVILIIKVKQWLVEKLWALYSRS